MINEGEDWIYGTEFNVKIADLAPVEPVAAEIYSASLDDGVIWARPNQAFNVTVVTSTGVSGISFTNEYGKDMGKSLVSRTVDGDKITWVYTMSIGSKGNRFITVNAMDGNGEIIEQTETVNIRILK